MRLRRSRGRPVLIHLCRCCSSHGRHVLRCCCRRLLPFLLRLQNLSGMEISSSSQGSFDGSVVRLFGSSVLAIGYCCSSARQLLACAHVGVDHGCLHLTYLEGKALNEVGVR